MKIKKIFVSGFKSFMERLEVPVPVGISAIVGPNGCGKSNIVDAIRWAMGEQSAKQLRGRAMEDVIFGGAGDFKPLGMAEVSIIFENGDGSFPAPYTHDAELSITRRLYRSGDSEYLINNVQCRLKDIQEIFMDTGLGNRAYSIIGQGTIGSIVDQRPEETRAMLEEASGITKYRKKVEESKRKIALTEDNLHRVEDILLEVQRQMRSLKRQASKARRYKAISQEIQDLELLLHANSYHVLKEESGNKVKFTDEFVQEEIAYSTRLSGMQAGIEKMNLELDEKDKEIAVLRDAFLQIKEKVNRKESILESMAGEKRMQQELESRLKKEVEDLERRLRELGREQVGLKEKIEQVTQSSNGLEGEIAILNERVKKRQDLLRRVKEEYEEARSQLNTGMSREMSLTQETGYLSKRIGEITDSRTRLEQEKADVLTRIDEITGASRKKNEVREALGLKIEDIERNILREQGNRDELVQVKKNIERDLSAKESDLNVNQSRLTSLKSLADNFEGYKVGVRTIMKADDLQAHKDGRVLGLVADFLQVDSKYEQAVEAILADKLQYIIVENQGDGKEAVDYLKDKAKGRGTFVPLKDLTSNGNCAHSNGFPMLRELVNVSDDYRPIMDLLLGDTAVVGDLGEAINAWSSNGRDQALVTLEGDTVDKHGIVSGGRLAHSSHGILSRKREIRELEKAVEKCRQSVETLKERLFEIDVEIEKRDALIEKWIEEKNESREKINELDKTIFRLSHELDQLQSMTDRISRDADSQGKEQEKHRDALQRIESELEQHKLRREQAQEYLSEKEYEMNECEQEFERFRNELTGLQMDYSRAQEERKGLVREVERIDDFTQDAQKTLARTGEEILQAKALFQDCVRREEDLQELLKGLYVELESAEEKVRTAENNRDQFHNEIRVAEKESDGIRAELEDVKEKIHQAKMEQSEINFKMNSLVEAVQERFNLNLPEIFQEHLIEDFSAADVKEKIEHQKMLKDKLGEVNLTAIQEHEALKERFDFITSQREDLMKSIESLNQAIRKINKTSLEKFQEVFVLVDNKLKEIFPILFNGGTAGLKLLDETKPLESGVIVEVKPPGKKLSHMSLLSGGEKALVAMALLFAIYLIKPSPFCMMDEVDAPLDEANIDRFNNLLKEIRKYSQVILVTHNRRSMEIVDRLYGVTMEQKGVSKIVSVDMQSYSNN